MLLAYALWTPQAPQEDGEDSQEQKTNFVQLSNEERAAHGIEVRVADKGVIQHIIRAPARISIVTDLIAHVLPKSSGIALRAYKNLGEQVQENEVLATLESKEIAEAKAEHLTSLKKLELADRTMQREQTLHEKRISSNQDYDAALVALKEATIDVDLTQQKLQALGLSRGEVIQLSNDQPLQLRIYEVRAPIPGKIISRHITPGERINNDQEIYVIADLSKVWAEINIFAQDRQYAKQGQLVTVTSHDGKKTCAKVVYLSPIIDEDTRTSTAIAVIDNNPEEWLPGAFVQAELIADEIPVSILIPKEAVQNIDGQDSVFITASDGFLMRAVSLGRSDDSHCEVLSGLSPGELYASKNTFLLKADLKKDEAEHMD